MDKLSKHNAAIVEFEREMRNMRKAGVACDKCGTELVYDDPAIYLTSHPPKMPVRCPSCGLTGLKLG